MYHSSILKLAIFGPLSIHPSVIGLDSNIDGSSYQKEKLIFLNNPFFESTCCRFELEVRQELVGRGAPLMELFAPNLGTLTRLETSEPPAFAFFSQPAVYYCLHAMARPPGESEGKSSWKELGLNWDLVAGQVTPSRGPRCRKIQSRAWLPRLPRSQIRKVESRKSEGKVQGNL